jgi:hypothetical protein
MDCIKTSHVKGSPAEPFFFQTMMGKLNYCAIFNLLVTQVVNISKKIWKLFWDWALEIIQMVTVDHIGIVIWGLTSKTTDLGVCNPSVSSERYGSEKKSISSKDLALTDKKFKLFQNVVPVPEIIDPVFAKTSPKRSFSIGLFSFFCWKRGYWVGRCANLANLLNFYLLITFKFLLLLVCKLSLFLRLLASVELTDGEGGGKEPSPL